jgi:hypothetical protein
MNVAMHLEADCFPVNLNLTDCSIRNTSQLVHLKLWQENRLGALIPKWLDFNEYLNICENIDSLYE